MALRNLMQAVIRSLLSLKMDTQLFEEFEESRSRPVTLTEPETTRKPSPLSKIITKSSNSNPTQALQSSLGFSQVENDAVIDIHGPKRPGIRRTNTFDAMPLLG